MVRYLFTREGYDFSRWGKCQLTVKPSLGSSVLRVFKMSELSEDSEVIMAGSDLHRHLVESVGENSFEVYDKEHAISNGEKPSKMYHFKKTAVSEVAVFTINEILHCKLLLDDDAAFLYAISSELLPFEENNEFRDKEAITINRVSNEMNTLSKFLISSLLDLVEVTKETTSDVLKAIPLSPMLDSPSHYLALSSLQAVGLEKYKNLDDIIEGNFNTGSIDVLFNTYLLMQSETLRRFGLGFCPNIQLHPSGWKEYLRLFTIVKKYNETCSCILKALEQQHKFHFVNQVKEKESTCANLKLIDGYLLVHKLTTSFSYLACQSRILKECLESTDEIECEKIIKEVKYQLNKMERDIEDVRNLVICSKKYFHKISSTTESETDELEPNDGIRTPTKLPKINKTGISVGYSDFTPADIDRVYLCVTDSSDSEVKQTEESGFEEPVMPNNLLTELKGALESKKKEFAKRELEAVQNNEDLAHYLNFVEPCEKTSDLPQCRTNLYNEISVPKIPTTELINTEGLSFQKSLAVLAASKSMNLNRCEEETYYDSSDLSENEI